MEAGRRRGAARRDGVRERLAGSESEREPRIAMKGIGCSRRRREGVRLWLGNPKCAYLYLEWLSGFVLGRLCRAL